MVFLTISAAAFIVAIFVFFGSLAEQTPGGEAKVLGINELEVLTVYQQAEADLYYIEQAAYLSGQQVNAENFATEFEESFALYLENFGLSLEDYSFSYTESESMYTILGETEKELVYEEESFVYRVIPNFYVEVSVNIVEAEGFLEV